jgi:hypothetical protein
MWVLVAVYHWGSSGHDLFNLKMVLDLVGKATTFQDGFRLVVSVTGEGRSLSSSVMAPSMVQAVSGGTSLFSTPSDPINNSNPLHLKFNIVEFTY